MSNMIHWRPIIKHVCHLARGLPQLPSERRKVLLRQHQATLQEDRYIYRFCCAKRRTCQDNYAMQKWAIMILEMDTSHYILCVHIHEKHTYIYLYLSIYLYIYRSISTWHLKYAGPAPGGAEDMGAAATCPSGWRRLGWGSFPVKVKWQDCLKEILHLLTQYTTSKLHNIALKACNFHPLVLAHCMV